MHIFTLNENNELVGTFDIQVDCEEGFYNHQTKAGLYKCWADEERLQLNLPGNAGYRYSVVDGIRVEKEFDYITPLKKELLSKIKPLCRSILSNYERFISKYYSQLVRLNNNKNVLNPMGEDELNETSDIMQMYRDLSNISETYINSLSTIEELELVKKHLNHDYSCVKFARKMLQVLNGQSV